VNINERKLRPEITIRLIKASPLHIINETNIQRKSAKCPNIATKATA
jgi:hypothetical protein